MNTGVFLTFAVHLKMPMVPFRVTFGSLGSKTEFLGHAVRVSGRSFLCLFPEQNLGDALGSLGLVLLDDVGIEALCGVHAGMTQLLGDGDNVRTVGQQNRSHRVPLRSSLKHGANFSKAIPKSPFLLNISISKLCMRRNRARLAAGLWFPVVVSWVFNLGDGGLVFTMLCPSHGS